MAKKSYAAHVTTLLGTTIALMLFIFILVSHHRTMPDRVQHGRSTLLSNPGTADERIKPVGEVAVASADAPPESGAPAAAPAATPPAAGAAAPEAAPAAARDGQQVYQTACVVCHSAGIAGAPKMGDKGQWAARIAKGADTLYASAVKGLNAMPPKGGNMTLSDAEVKAAVDYMVAQSK
jgi:cytochrome c5